MLFVPFLLPVRRYPVESSYREWLAFTLGSIAFVALGMVARERRIEAPRAVVLPVGLGLLLAVQVAAGKLAYWQEGVLGALYLLWAAGTTRRSECGTQAQPLLHRRPLRSPRSCAKWLEATGPRWARW